MTRIEMNNEGEWVHVAPEGYEGLARTEDPETSHEAAEQVDATVLMDKIWNVMARFGEAGCIGDQVDDLLPDVVPQSITPRYRTMVNLGMIEVTGEKRTGHKCNRSQMVRRVLPLPHTPRSVSVVKDARIVQARGAVLSIRNAMGRMCSEDRVRLNFLVGRLEEILK